MAQPSTTGSEPMLGPEAAKEPAAEVVAPYVAEFIGTFLLVFTVGSCSIAGDANWNYTAIACILMVSIYAFGPVSGGHFNPSVSFACGLTRVMPWLTVLLYVICQVAGGCAGGWLYYAMFSAAAAVKPVEGYVWFHVGVVEVAYTFMICFVVLNVAVSKRNNPKEDQNHFFGLAIGFVIVAGGYSAGSISGTFINPAITLGLDVTGSGGTGGKFDWRLVYVGFQLLGSVAAAILYSFCRFNESDSTAPADATLQVRILAGHNLRHRDSEAFGDVSEPYVLARVGLDQCFTPTGQSSSPGWASENVFYFEISDFQLLELEVMERSATGDDISLGTLNVHQQDVPTGEWRHWKERLVVGNDGEIEFVARILDDSDFKPSLTRRALCEFIGTFMLVLTVGLNLITKSVATPFSAAAALMCMIYSLGNVSGGHFNPAVTLAVVLSRRGKCTISDGIVYVVAQLFAAILAGLLYGYVHFTGPYKDEAFALTPGATFGWWAVFCAELAFTFMLAFVVLAVATVTPPKGDTKQNFHFALAIGSCVTAGGFAVGAISGGELNPAVSLGIATASNMSSGSSAAPWIYCIFFGGFELVGGVLAALVFFLTHSHEYTTKV